MIDSLFSETVKSIDGWENMPEEAKRMVKGVYILGFGDSFHTIQTTIYNKSPEEAVLLYNSLGEEINRKMAELFDK